MAYKTKKAFSLVETLIAMLIIGVVFALAIPFMTKTLANKDKLNKGNVGFYFKQADRDKAMGKCFIPVDNSKSGNSFTVVGSTDCQEYEFVVPKDIHYIDLTLVAGGGGGGGASGGMEYEEQMPVLPPPSTLPGSSSSGALAGDSSPILNRISLYDTFYKYVFKVMVGNGENGKSSSGNTTGKGGHSGYAIADYVINREGFFKTLFANSFNKTKRGQIKATQLLPGTTGFFDNQIFINYLWKENEPGKSGWRRFRINEYSSSDCDDYRIINTQDTECLLYEINTPSGNYTTSDDKEELVCRYHIKNDTTDEITTTNCYNSIPTVNQILRQSGMKGTAVTTSNYTEHNAHYQGARGGYISDEIAAGQGGQGGDIIIDGNVFKTSDGKPGQEGAAEVYQYALYPGAVASGGVGGAAVKLKNFPVVPGKKYKIYVGNGGAGGTQGERGYAESTPELVFDSSNTYPKEIKYNIKVKQEEKSGTRGQGGTSTAIFDENDNLVLLVMGGVGGREGKATKDSERNAAPAGVEDYRRQRGTTDPIRDEMFPKETIASRHYPMVLVNNKNSDIIEKYLDPSYENLNNVSHNFQPPASNSINMNPSWDFKVVGRNYNEQTNETDNTITNIKTKEMVRLFNLNNPKMFYDTISTSDLSDDKKTGSFLAYDRNSTTDNNEKDALYYKISTESDVTYFAYHGFYLRYVDDFDYMYAGGLGGFSGLGTKAGCGGGFVGNKDGNIYTEQTDATKNTPIILQATAPDLQGTFIAGLEKNNKHVYYVKDYFDNCTLNSPNGQSAEFIPPSISLIDGELVGQAGAGGGGGGWSTKYGAGKGGDGQAGYVFITWKKF